MCVSFDRFLQWKWIWQETRWHVDAVQDDSVNTQAVCLACSYICRQLNTGAIKALISCIHHMTSDGTLVLITVTSGASNAITTTANIADICGLQLPREPHRSTRLLQLTGRWRDDAISITLRQIYLSTFLIRFDSFSQLSSYSILLTKLDGPRSRAKPYLKLWKCRELNADMLVLFHTMVTLLLILSVADDSTTSTDLASTKYKQ